jgi:nucleoside-diphosphate-sugar epimerase
MPTTTVVTGANGFVGATIVDLLLSQTYHHDKVVLAVRRAESADALIANNPSWPKDKLIVQAIPDIAAPGAFDTVFQTHPDIDYVIHVAAPLIRPDANDFVKDFQEPNVAGTKELLTSAKRYGKSVKAISVTGSINAITTGAQEDVKSRAFTNTEWLPMGAEEAIKMQNPFVSKSSHNPVTYLLISQISYCVGKKLAEQAIWEFIETEKPAFTVTTFLPPLIYGPMLQVIKDTKSINLSNNLLYSIFTSATSEDGKVPPTMFPGCVSLLARQSVA